MMIGRKTAIALLAGSVLGGNVAYASFSDGLVGGVVGGVVGSVITNEVYRNKRHRTTHRTEPSNSAIAVFLPIIYSPFCIFKILSYHCIMKRCQKDVNGALK